MRTVAVTVVGLVTGLVTGILLSEFIGIVGYLAFDRLVGIRFLPVILGAVFAAAAPFVEGTDTCVRPAWCSSCCSPPSSP